MIVSKESGDFFKENFREDFLFERKKSKGYGMFGEEIDVMSDY